MPLELLFLMCHSTEVIFQSEERLPVPGGVRRNWRRRVRRSLYGGGAAAVQKHGYMQDVYDSETESESDESDCEEAFPPRGGVQHSYGAYKEEKHGAGNLGGVRRYESYETREDGGRRYESYQSTVQYTGGGGGGYATCSPIKNRHLLRYGA